MARPNTKQELLEQSKSNYLRLLDFIHSLNPEKLNAEFPEGYLNRNIRDVLAHLHEWHLMMISWYEVGMKGNKPDIPAKGYTWKTTPELNREIWKKYQQSTLEEVSVMLQGSFQDIQSLIEGHSDEELFEKKRYTWTGSTSLGAYLISASSSHYDWALKLIKKCLK